MGKAASGIRGALLAVGLAACRPEPESAASLELLRFDQDGEDGVLLNEGLVFHFSGEIDGSSATRAVVDVRAADGTPARGRILVDRERLVFSPILPLAQDLSDGGFLPGRDYTAEILGFPLPDGLRGRSGEPLTRSWRGSFRTVAAGEGERLLFEDPSIDRAVPLRAASVEIAALDPLTLLVDEPVDPRSLHAEDFELRHYRSADPTAPPASEGAAPVLERIGLQARLVRNDAGGAEIELRPLGATGGALRALEIGEHHLWVDPETCRLRDFGGHPIPPGWAVGPQPTLEIRVREDRPGPRQGMHRESFLDARMRSPAPVEGGDGTAYWSDDGTVTMRLPRSAGSGADGVVDLEGEEGRRRIEASTLRLPEGAECSLSQDAGLVLIACQGRMEISGRLTRFTAEDEFAPLPDESHVDWQLRLTEARRAGRVPETSIASRSLEAGAGLSLSDWLVQVGASGESWTVLVAGGDIVVTGAIHVNSRLLLVAGGWVRVPGSVAAREVWRSREGGGSDIWPSESLARLAIDPPVANPLVRPLRCAVLSAPIRPPRGVLRWRQAEVGGRAGNGSWRVSYLGERDAGGREVQVVGPVGDPRQLEGCGSIRILIELEAPPGGSWDPPLVDFVELGWDEPAAARGERGQ